LKIVADEGIEKPVVVKLRAEGHHVIYIAEIAQGAPDIDVLALSHQEEALLITFDKDFGDLIFHQHYQSRGVVLVRLPDELSSSEKANIIVDVINTHGEKLFGAFTVITSSKIRVINFPPKRNRSQTDETA
jgi:predicted nuclease of predicted toxin-antitoxin system